MVTAIPDYQLHSATFLKPTLSSLTVVRTLHLNAHSQLNTANSLRNPQLSTKTQKSNFTYSEQISCYNCKSSSIVSDTGKFWVAVQHRAEDVQEKLERILIQEVNLVQAVHRKVHTATCL
jgi:hypothetical protein